MEQQYTSPITTQDDAAGKPPVDDGKLERYKAEYNRWLKKLEPYHTGRFDRNYKQYTAYTETKGTHTKISDPVAPELVERVVQKFFARDPKFYAVAHGRNLPKEITSLIASAAEYLWTNPDTVQSTGTMRQKLKVGGREFCIIGNVGTETYFNGEADSADFRVVPLEDVIFDPSKTLKTSTVYYVRQWVSLEYLESMKEVTENGEVVSGVFNAEAVQYLQEKYEGKEQSLKNDPSSNKVTRTGSNQIEEIVDDILLISRYEGKKVCRFADFEVTLQEYDNEVLGDDPLDFAMDVEVPKQPFAFSMLDFISGLTTAKDLFLNQTIDWGAKALNPPLFVDPSVIGTIDKKTLVNAYKLGGIVFAPPDSAKHQAMPELPNNGFNLLTYMQQRAESVTGIGAYLSGVPNQESDKTNGTKGGIEALISQAQSPLMDRQQNLEESLIEPIINKMLKITGATMAQDEIKWVLITGQSPTWVAVTRGLLTGKIRKSDLVTAGLISPEEAMEIDQMLALQGKNPDEEILFDVDWFIRVETGSMAELDQEQDLQAFDGTMAAAKEMGLPVDWQKVWVERAVRAGVKEPEQYLLTPEQQAAMAAQAAASAVPTIGSTPLEVPGGQPMPQNMPQGMPAPAMAV